MRGPTVLLIGNGGPGQVGGYFARSLQSLDYPFEFVDEARCFAPPGRSLWRRAIDRALIRPEERRRFGELVMRRARELRPAVVLVISGRHLTPDVLRQVRDDTKAVLIAYATDNPLVPGASRTNLVNSLAEYDLYASPRRASLEALRARGCRCPIYLRFGYDAAVHFPESAGAAEAERWSSDAVFIGGADEERVALLEPLARSGGAVLSLYGRGWSRTRLRRHGGGEVFDREFRLALGGAKVAPCLVRRSNGDGHVMRTFEVPACGQFMLAERTAEHLELFEEHTHVACFEEAEELRDKTLYYLAHETERVRMAEAGHKLVISGAHTYRDRVSELLSRGLAA